ncbi:hypothetical protein Psi01_35090 [Planobispora siamensis]|uniref:Uncharacterized protein n=1 Tax=Planobispora siamensis TaxID=936338 RepID=A0A8J3SGG2_9ACTN|nr:hypothetical protein Psi01_35090 [Planobispora siamensis]
MPQITIRRPSHLIGARGQLGNSGRQVTQVHRARPPACAVRAHRGAAGRFSLAFAGRSQQPGIVAVAFHQNVHGVSPLPGQGRGDEVWFLSGPHVELGGARVVLVQQAVAGIGPCLERVLLDRGALSGHGTALQAKRWR